MKNGRKKIVVLRMTLYWLRKKFMVEVRKSRVASVGVTELMKMLKLKKKRLIDKRRAKVSKIGLSVSKSSYTASQ